MAKVSPISPDVRILAARGRPLRLAQVISHPIPNLAPLYRALATDPRIDLIVYFAADWGMQLRYDSDFRQSVAWDVPLTEGYEHRFLRSLNVLPFAPKPIGQLNPALPWHLWRGRFDAVLVHGYATLPSLLAMVAAKLARVPVLLRVETPPRRRPWHIRLPKRAYLKLVFGLADAVLYAGSLSRNFCLSYGASSERLFWVPYVVENERFAGAAGERASSRAQLGIAPERCAILFVAKLRALKRPLDVVRAMAQAADPRLVLLVAGDGELREAMAAEALRLGVDVRLLGFVNQAAMPRTYAAADLLVLASDTETWGLVVNEAMAAGLPVVVTRAAGCAPDLVQEGENGRTFRPGDVPALASALAELASDAALRCDWGRRSAAIVAQYAYATDVAGIVEALRAVKAGKRRGRP